MPAAQLLVHHLGHHDLYLIAELGLERHVLAILGHRISSWTSRLLAQLAPLAPAQLAELLDAEAAELRLPTAMLLKLDDVREPSAAVERLFASKAPAQVVGIKVPLLPAALLAWRGDVAPNHDGPATVLLTCSPDVRETGRSTADLANLVATLVPLFDPRAAAEVLAPPAGDPFDLVSMNHYLADQVAPAIERHMLAARSQADKAPALQLYVSPNTGTSAAIWALTNGLRRFRPKLIAIPKCRTRPKLGSTMEATVLADSWLDGAHPRPAAELADPAWRLAAKEMVQWREEFSERKRRSDSDLDDFWLKKSGKPVLAVLVCRDDRGELQAHRGCNLEVSLPTGSLCAERNAISSALAARPNLRRDQMLCIAVLGLGMSNPLEPCGVCREWLLKIAEQMPGFRVLTFADDAAGSVLVRAVE